MQTENNKAVCINCKKIILDKTNRAKYCNACLKEKRNKDKSKYVHNEKIKRTEKRRKRLIEKMIKEDW